MLLLLLSTWSSGLVWAGEGALLGVLPGFPRVSYSGQLGQACTYDSTNDLLTINSTPGLTLFGPLPTGPLGFVIGGMVTITANIDGAGTISGGSFILNGSIFTPPGPFADPLLTGTVSDYGIVDLSPTLGGTDQADFRLTPTGGSMLGLISPDDVGITTTLEISTYSGTMTSDWNCGRAKGDIGPIPPPTGGEGACSQGFWKNHVSQWPVASLTLGSIVYNQAQLLAFLKMKAKGDKSLILAKQLIAAKLNVAGGSDSSCIASTIAAADDWLDLNAPGGIPGNVNQWNDGEDLKEDLDLYNNGELCAGPCTR